MAVNLETAFTLGVLTGIGAGIPLGILAAIFGHALAEMRNKK